MGDINVTDAGSTGDIHANVKSHSTGHLLTSLFSGGVPSRP
jgi:hypothetical protein